ncbi:MAG: 1,4-dihydroxy-2-naphthoate polyprenyltransferase [Chloroherpetonaceae bacterium]|nr:1,4-dihydroxy-2-naphthoate polyprenyltransferase [Chloroherpetonaceae bacterium]MDW8437996.1 1,4-dihydroxy-2-naphthoate polyprenyltransferase [Chloroherpetonaceae bacterium]
MNARNEAAARLEGWILATKPRTLVAAVVPVLLGTSLAYADGKVDWLSAAIALVCAALIQIATNLINDLYDFRKGADNEKRLGAKKALNAGLLTERDLAVAATATMLAAFGLGLILVWRAGWAILAIGLLSLFFAWAYTGGKYPLAYLGLGDAFVFLFFGLVAVCGTYYAHHQTVSLASVVVATGVGAIATNILGVNNLRDIPTDREVGKKTLAVRFGEEFARDLYYWLLFVAYCAPFALALMGYGYGVLLALLSLPFAMKQWRIVALERGRALNAALGGTAQLLLIYGALLSVGLLLSRFGKPS